MINKGEAATDFKLKDQYENEIKLSDLKGKRVLLSFHPLAWTPVCARQMRSLEDNQMRLTELNTIALGISVDSVPSKKAWAKEIGVENTKLLADFWPHGGVAKSLGIFRDGNGFSERANIILDKDGKVVFIKIYPLPEVPDLEEILNALKGMN